MTGTLDTRERRPNGALPMHVAGLPDDIGCVLVACGDRWIGFVARLLDEVRFDPGSPVCERGRIGGYTRRHTGTRIATLCLGAKPNAIQLAAALCHEAGHHLLWHVSDDESEIVAQEVGVLALDDAERSGLARPDLFAAYGWQRGEVRRRGGFRYLAPIQRALIEAEALARAHRARQRFGGGRS